MTSARGAADVPQPALLLISHVGMSAAPRPSKAQVDKAGAFLKKKLGHRYFRRGFRSSRPGSAGSENVAGVPRGALAEGQ